VIRTVFFDLGGVFVNVNPGATLRLLRDRCDGVTENEIAETLFHSEAARNYEQGLIDSASFFETINRRIGATMTFDEFRETWQDMFTLIRPMADLLPDFARRWRLGMISNTNAMHVERIRRDYDIFRFFDPLIFSCEVGSAKPSETIFRLALERAGVRAEDCAFVDDTPVNVEAAVKLGMVGFHFTNPEEWMIKMGLS
jgi:glucose-1-phosphatase